jgi:hypothetical protein
MAAPGASAPGRRPDDDSARPQVPAGLRALFENSWNSADKGKKVGKGKRPQVIPLQFRTHFPLAVMEGI